MSKKEKKEAIGEEVPLLERDLYERVEKFFSEKKACKKTGSAVSSPISLSIFGGMIYPDVYGIKDPENPSFTVYMAEGKRDFGGRNFDICKGQAISLQRFSDFVYLFFPKESWNLLSDEAHKEITEECREQKLGLIFVDGNECEELIQAVRNTDLLKDERREEARDLVVQYFPNFLSEENKQFFQQFSRLAMNIAGESNTLLNKCSDAFRRETGASRTYTHIYYNKGKGYFQICYMRELKPACDLYLTVNPFGHFLFEKDIPRTIIEQWFGFAYYLRKGLIDNLLKYCNKCLKANSKIEVRYVERADWFVENFRQLSRIMKNPEDKIEYVIVYQPIELFGRETGRIVKDTSKVLSELSNFLKLQRKFAKKRPPENENS